MRATHETKPGQHLERIRRALQDPAVYAHAVDSVDLIETHISLLFFAGSRVYKVKKPLRTGFLDYSTLARRRRCCELEVGLNRRLAPDTYRGVVAISRGTEDRLTIGGSGPVIDYAVEMNRLPEQYMLESLLERGAVQRRHIHDLTDVLVDFHSRVETGNGVDRYATPEALRATVGDLGKRIEIFAASPGALEPIVPPTLSTPLLVELRTQLQGFVQEHEELLLRRLADGRIRNGHGDLHCANICLLPQGVTIYDCIEFSRRLRCGDVAAELAFLAMDLEFRGRRDLSLELLEHYAQRTEDPDLFRLMPFYKTYRACVRGLVHSLQADQEHRPEQPSIHLETAARYFHRAASYTVGPGLILICGLPGSGKTWVARKLADSLGAELLCSDVLRKRLAHLEPTARATAEISAGLYLPSMTRYTYWTLVQRAEALLEQRRLVVIDATFSRRRQRDLFVQLAARNSVPLVLVQCSADEQTIRERLQKRSQQSEEASDATFDVYLAMRSMFEEPLELPAEQVYPCRTPEEPTVTTRSVIEQLVLQRPAARNRSCL